MITITDFIAQYRPGCDTVAGDSFGCAIRITPPTGCDPRAFAKLAYRYYVAIAELGDELIARQADSFLDPADLPGAE